MAVSIVASTPATGGSAPSLGSTDATIPAISGYVPQLGDAVLLFGNCNSATPTMFTTADWSLISVTTYTTTNIGFCRGHAITPAEVTAGTNSWTIPGIFNTGGAGRGIAVVVRGGDGVSAVTANQASAAAAAVTFPSVTPLRDGSLILGYVAPDATGSGVGDPGSGWTTVVKSSNNVGVTSQSVIRLLVNAAGGVPVNMTNAALALNAADEWATITVAIPPPASTSGFFALV